MQRSIAKAAPTGGRRREQAVQARILKQCDPQNREAVEHLWREIVGWGLARQGRLQVQVWAPIDPAKAVDGARLRFGAAAVRLAEQRIFDHMVAWVPPNMTSVPIAEAIRRRKKIDLDSDKVQTARDIGICLGD